MYGIHAHICAQGEAVFEDRGLILIYRLLLYPPDMII